MRLIDADELLAQMIGMKDGWFDPRPAYDYESLIKIQPTIDAAPVVHGRWELVDAAEPQRYGCSKCSCLSWYGTYRYCPNCGAKMDLEEQDAAD